MGKKKSPKGSIFLPHMGPREKWKSPYFFFFFRETHFHSLTTQMQAIVTIYYHCIIFLLLLNAKVCVMATLLLN